MNILIAGGSGFVGTALVKDRLAKGDKVSIVSRKCSKSNLPCHAWDDLTSESLANFDVIVNLAGENIGEKRWSDKRKNEILSSRINTTQKIADLCSQIKENKPLLLNASAIGIYGADDAFQKKVFVESDVTDEPFKPTSFLQKVALAWEEATRVAKKNNIRVVNMRFGVVLDNRGGLLAQLKLPYLLGLGGVVGTGEQLFSWIALDDLLSAIDFVINDKSIIGAVNFVAPCVVTQREFAAIYAAHLKRFCVFKMPAWLLKLFLGQMAEELLLQGVHVKPQVLQNNGFNFKYASLAELLPSKIHQ